MPSADPQETMRAELEHERRTQGRRPLARWTERRLRLVVSVFIAALGAATVFKLRTVPVPTDPWHYVIAGMTFPAESWNTVGLTRYGMVLPMIPLTRFFHQSELSFYLTPCLVSGLLLGAVYWLSDRFFGRVAGFAAAVLTMANGVVLSYSSRMYPDVFAAAMTTMAVAAAVAARDEWDRVRATDHASIRGLIWRLLLTGALVGMSWWMRETAIFAWPVVAGVLLWRGGPPWRMTIPVAAAPALMLLGVEMLISAWAFGDPMARFEALTGPDLSATTNPADMPYLGQSRVSYFTTIPRVAWITPDGRWMIVLGLVALLSTLFFWRKTGLFAAWFLLVFGLLTLAGGALRPGHPNIRLDVVRYWIAFIPPMVILAVGGVATLLGKFSLRWPAAQSATRRRTAAGLVLATLLLAGPVLAAVSMVRQSPTFVVTNQNVTAKFRNWLHVHDRQVANIYTDWESGRILPTFTRSFTGRPMATVTWHSLTGEPVHRGDYVVLFSAFNQTCFFCNANINDRWLPRHLDDLERWDRVWQTEDRSFVVYRVTHHRSGR